MSGARRRPKSAITGQHGIWNDGMSRQVSGVVPEQVELTWLIESLVMPSIP